MAATSQRRLFMFEYTGTDSRGRRVSGQQEGASLDAVRAILRRQGIRPTRIRRQQTSIFQITRRVRPKDIALMSRQLATMISAGIPVAQSIGAIARGHPNQKMREMLARIRQGVEGGTALSQVLRGWPGHFDRLYLSLVAVGEQSGTLDRMMEKVAAHLEKIESIKGRVRSAMFYPAAVLFVAVVVVSILLIFVIPQFETLFRNFGGELPTLTQGIIDLSAWFRQWWWLAFIVLVSGFALLRFTYKRSPRLQYLLDRLILKLPVFGPLFYKAAIARFSRTLATMFGAGVPLVDALASVAGATGNRVFYNATFQVRSEVSTGRSLEASMTATGIFPSMVLQMVATGEETGELERMLDKVADFYEQEVEDAVNALSSLLEPIMIVILGVIVGTIVVAMYLPIFKLAAVF